MEEELPYCQGWWALDVYTQALKGQNSKYEKNR